MPKLTLQNRELVIEIEKVERIRRTAKTRIALCQQCGSKCDFVDLIKIAELFESAPCKFLDAVRANGCHISTNEQGVQICVTSFLALLRRGAVGKDLSIECSDSSS